MKKNTPSPANGNAHGAQTEPADPAPYTNPHFQVLDHRTMELREMNWTTTGTCPCQHHWPGNTRQWKLHALHMKEICND